MSLDQLLSELGVPKRVRRRLRCANNSDERAVFHTEDFNASKFDINQHRSRIEFRMLSNWKEKQKRRRIK